MKIREKIRIKSTAEDLVIVYLEQSRYPQCMAADPPESNQAPKTERSQPVGLCGYATFRGKKSLRGLTVPGGMN